jgi:hypothetical protein
LLGIFKRCSALVAFCLLVGGAKAGVAAVHSWAEVSEDGSRLLVVQAPREDAGEPEIELPDGRIVNLRTDFEASGLYAIDRLEPIWAFEDGAKIYNTRSSADMDYVVCINGGAPRGPAAVRLFHEGKLFKEIAHHQLVKRFKEAHWLPLNKHLSSSLV